MVNIDDIQKIAALAIREPTYTDFLRRICRWYSKTFSTPLHEVELLDDEYVLTHYFENYYESLEKEDLHNKLIHLLETPEEREQRKRAEEDDELAFLKQVEEEARKKKLKAAKDKAQEVINKEPIKSAVTPLPEEEIVVNYVDPDLMEEGMDEDSLG